MLRFHPNQFKKYPKRPWPFFKKPYVMYLTSLHGVDKPGLWYDGKYGHVLNWRRAVRVSAEQAGYLAERGYDTVCVKDLDDLIEPPLKFIDVCRLPSSPLRLHPGRRPPVIKSSYDYCNAGPHHCPEKTELAFMTIWQRLMCFLLGVKTFLKPLDVTPQQKIALATDTINAAQAKYEKKKYDVIRKGSDPEMWKRR